MTMFLVLNGIAVVFVLYVLVNFWKEGRRTARGGVRSHQLQSMRGSNPELFIVTGPLEVAARRHDKTSLIRFPVAKGLTHKFGGNPPRSTARLR
jgi:hypothetical protein